MMQPGILAYFLWTCQAPFNWNWRPVKMGRAGLHKLAAICGRALLQPPDRNSGIVRKPMLSYWQKKKKKKVSVDLWTVSVLL